MAPGTSPGSRKAARPRAPSGVSLFEHQARHSSRGTGVVGHVERPRGDEQQFDDAGEPVAGGAVARLARSHRGAVADDQVPGGLERG